MVAKKILAASGIRVVGYVKQVGHIKAEISNPAEVTLEQVEANIVRCPDANAAEQMISLIDEMRMAQDSIGGVSELVATGVPAGLGEPVFDKIKLIWRRGSCRCRQFWVLNMEPVLKSRQARGVTTTTPSSPRRMGDHDSGESARRHAGWDHQWPAHCLPGGDQTDEQSVQTAVNGDANRRADGDQNEGPARSMPVASLCSNGGSDDGDRPV